MSNGNIKRTISQTQDKNNHKGSNFSQKPPKIQKTSRPNTPEILGFDPNVEENFLGAGSFGSVSSYAKKNDKGRIAIKIAHPSDNDEGSPNTNDNILHEHLIKQTILEIINYRESDINELDSKFPIVPSITYKVSEEFFPNKKNVSENLASVSMPHMDCSLLEKKLFSPNFVPSNQKEFDILCKQISDAGIIIKDLTDDNIFIKGSDIYLGDVGEFELKKDSQAYKIYHNLRDNS